MRHQLIAIFLVAVTAPLWIGLLSAAFTLGLQLLFSAPWVFVVALVLLFVCGR
jgi:hypothetical protein